MHSLIACNKWGKNLLPALLPIESPSLDIFASEGQPAKSQS
jgi:hypothetical protein